MNDPVSRTLRIATRASALALWQANFVADALRAAVRGLAVEIVHVSTIGDRDQSGALNAFDAQGVFTREVQKAVLERRADVAVHSLKDLPTSPVGGLVLAAVPSRGPYLDALVLPAASAAGTTFETLPSDPRIGTGSPRRRAQLWHTRPDLNFQNVRGNVETRLRKLDAGEYDALILAVAGLTRLGLEGRISEVLKPPLLFPAVGQGALGIECRDDDEEAQAWLGRLSDLSTLAATRAERALLHDLGAGCHAPLGVWSEATGALLTLEGVVLSQTGETRLHASLTGPLAEPEELGRAVARQLRDAGAEALLS